MSMLFLLIQKASLSRFISFHQDRIPKADVIALVSEMTAAGYINKCLLHEWKERMVEHNRILARGKRMNLLPWKYQGLEFSSLGSFMMQIQRGYLAHVLDNFSSFGERIVERIRENSDALFWVVDGPIQVEQINWIVAKL